MYTRMKTPRYWARPLLAAILVLVLILSACARATPAGQQPTAAPTEAKEPYRVGVMSILSGPLAGPGIQFRDGIVFEVEQINAKGGINGHPIELFIEDDGGDPTRAATALTKLIREDEVLAVLGSFFSALEAASRAVTEREQVPQIMGHPSNAEMRAKNFRWSFNIAPNEILGAAALVEILKDGGYTKVTAVAESGPLYQAVLERLITEAEGAGIQVVPLPDTMNIEDVDVTPQVTKLKELVAKEKPQAVVLVASATAATFLKTMKQLALDLPVVGWHGLGSPLLLQLAGPDANGMVVPGSKIVLPESLDDADPQKALLTDFFRRFQEKNGRAPGVEIIGASAVRILAHALEVAGPDRAGIRDAIENTTNFVTYVGTYSFSPDDHEGLSLDSMAIFEVKDGKFVLVRPLQ